MKILAMIQWNKEQNETWENKKIIDSLAKIWVTICYLSPEINLSNNDVDLILKHLCKLPNGLFEMRYSIDNTYQSFDC